MAVAPSIERLPDESWYDRATGRLFTAARSPLAKLWRELARERAARLNDAEARRAALCSGSRAPPRTAEAEWRRAVTDGAPTARTMASATLALGALAPSDEGALLARERLPGVPAAKALRVLLRVSPPRRLSPPLPCPPPADVERCSAIITWLQSSA